MTKVKTKTIDGKHGKEMALPSQFNEPVRTDLIKAAVLAIQSNRRQAYGAKPEAGKRASAKLSRRRHDFKTSYGIGISRVPRKIFSRTGTRFNWQAAFAPGTVGGRRAHPPKAEKKYEKKMNKKERRKAIRSALSASVLKELVEKRGHLVNDYPLVLDKEFENIDKTKKVIEALEKLDLKEELKRCSERKIRAGKGKSRGRKYKVRKGPLIVVSQDCSLIKAAKNILGVDVEVVDKLNVELLAPGTSPGRLTLYTESAIKRLEDEKLFTNNPVRKEVKKAGKEREENKEIKTKKEEKTKQETKAKEIKKATKSKKTEEAEE